jgi:hypothetical protein
MLFFKRLSVIVVLLAVGVLSVGTTAHAITSGGVGGRPAHPDPNSPRTQSIFIFTANKGEAKRDVILVSNNSDQKQTIDLYAVDGVVTNTGSYTCSQQSEAREGMGAWIALDKTAVTLEAGKTEEVGFSLTMPADADVGEHNGCIVFQLQGDEGQATGNVRILTRQAIRVVATVPGDLHRDIAIEAFTVADKGGEQVYELGLKNSGNVSADVDAKVYLTSLFGGTIYENGGGYPVLADRKLDLTFVNDKKPFFGGWYYVQAKVSYDKRAGSFGVGEAANVMTKESEKRIIFVAPTIGGLLVIITAALLLGGAGAWLYASLRTRRQVLMHGSKHIVKKGETVQSIATDYGIGWRKLTSINKIAAPYVLKTGDVVRVPKKETKRKTLLNRTKK